MTNSDETLAAALQYARQGWSVIALPRRSKNPNRAGWQKERLGVAEVGERFAGRELNLGVLLGEPSGGLVDLDLDAAEAGALAEVVWPGLALAFGRAGKPRSHLLVRCAEEVATRKYLDPTDRAVLLEVRSTGAQTVFPPSTHPGGERIGWTAAAEGGTVPAQEFCREELLLRAGVLAALALLARHWPGPGSRHDASLALAGLLVRAEWAVGQAGKLIGAVAQAAGDEQWAERGQAAASTAQTLDGGKPATGAPTLAALIGAEVVARACEWLGIEWTVDGGQWAVTSDEVTVAANPAPTVHSPLPTAHPPALYGFIGEVTAALDEHTEADRLAVAAHLLAGFGAAVGKGPHMMVGANRHEPRLFFALVGKSSKARKGESWAAARLLLEYADAEFTERRVLNGLSSGEGLISAVRDRVEREEKKRNGEIERVLVDAGEPDKRLLVVETEFARSLTVLSRQGNTLSAVIRDAWDRGDLNVMTKQPTRATGAHITMVVHITRDELRRSLGEVETLNGFANRFVWLAVQRSKLLPDPEPFRGAKLWEYGGRLGALINWASGVGEMTRDDEARALWREVYAELGAERDGVIGSLTARAEAQVLRLSLLYALLDQSAIVRVEHLRAALDFWRYSEGCVEQIFGDSTGDRIADTILAALRQRGSLTRTGISDLFNGNQRSGALSAALDGLLERGRITAQKQTTALGRPILTYRLAQAPEPD